MSASHRPPVSEHGRKLLTVTHSAGAEDARVRSGVAGRLSLDSWLRAAVIASFFFLTWVGSPVRGRDLTGCRMSEELDYWCLMSPIGDWPAYRYAGDLVSIGLGAETHNDRELVFSLLSVAGVAGSVLLGWLVLSRAGQRPWFWGFLVVAMSGPLVAYSRSTAGEALATGLLVCVVAATALRALPRSSRPPPSPPASRRRPHIRS